MRRRRLFSAIFACMIGLCGLPSPSEARPVELCDRFTADLRPADIEWMQYILRSRFPVRYVKTIDSLRFEEDEGGRLLGPIIVSDDPPTILVPKRFLQRLCDTVEIELRYGPEEIARIRKIGNECRSRTGGRLADCVDEMYAILLSVQNFPDDFDALQGKAIIAGLTLDAAIYLLSHEVAHLAIDQDVPEEELAGIDVETEADLLAFVAQMENSQSPRGMLFGLALTSLVESEAATYETHDNVQCRSRFMLSLIRDFYGPLARIRPPRAGIADEPVDIGADFSSPLLQGPTSSEICVGQAGPLVAAFKRDIARLEALVAELGPLPHPDVEVEGLVARARQLPLETRQARTIMLSLVSSALRNSESATRLLSVGSADLSGRQEALANARAIVEIAKLELGSDMRLDDRFALLTIEAVARGFTLPEGTPMEMAAAEILSGIDEALALQEPMRSVRVQLYFRRMLAAAVAEQAVVEGMVLGLHSTLEIVSKGCDGAVLDQLWTSRLADAFAVARRSINAENCPAMRAEVIAFLKTTYGWVPPASSPQ